MKILIVTTEWPRFDGDIGGIHVVQQKRRLEQAGLHVDVFPFRGQKNPLNYWRASNGLNSLTWPNTTFYTRIMVRLELLHSPSASARWWSPFMAVIYRGFVTCMAMLRH